VRNVRRWLPLGVALTIVVAVAAIVALKIDKGARRIWRAATASATN